MTNPFDETPEEASRREEWFKKDRDALQELADDVRKAQGKAAARDPIDRRIDRELAGGRRRIPITHGFPPTEWFASSEHRQTRALENLARSAAVIETSVVAFSTIGSVVGLLAAILIVREIFS